MKTFQRLWRDDAGFVVSTELILVATILVIGIVAGLNAVRNGVTNELADVSAAVDQLNQGHSVNGVVGHSASVAGWSFSDQPDFCSNDDQATMACINQLAGYDITQPTGGN